MSIGTEMNTTTLRPSTTMAWAGILPVPGATPKELDGDLILPEWGLSHTLLLLLNILVVFGNAIVIFAVLIDSKLRIVTTNKFIASLAVSDLLVGLIVMPLSLYSKAHREEWQLGYTPCQLHLASGVFSTTASIVHLVAISLDRYFAIMFPTEYQRHSVSTSTLPYVVMIWLMALAVSSTLMMEKPPEDGHSCWIHNPQYIVLSSLLSFFLPGVIVVYMYVKIFKKLRQHQLYMFGQINQKREKKRSLPRVIIEEVRSRRGSRLSQTGSNSGSPTRRDSAQKSERSPSQPEIHTVALPPQRWRSPTICAETFEHDRQVAAKKRVSIVPDPPSMDVSTCSNMAGIRQEHESAKIREADLTRHNSDDMMGTETLRKLSEERRLRREERRSMGLEIPLREAFDKAYASVSDNRKVSDASHLLSAATVCIRPNNQNNSTTHLSPHPDQLQHNEEDECIKPLLAIPGRKKGRARGSMDRIPPPTFLMVPAIMSINTPPLSPSLAVPQSSTLKVPRPFECPSPCDIPPSNSSHSSYTSGSSETRRISCNSFGSSMTEGTDSTYEVDSRRSSAWSTLRAAVLSDPRRGKKSTVDIHIDRVDKKSTISRGKLRRIATQVTRAIRRKRRESMAIRRESRATRVVAAILMAFLMCWLPFYVTLVYRGILTGCGISIDIDLHRKIYTNTSWLGYAHSCFNPLIYMCLNKNFRCTIRRLAGREE